MSFPTLSSRAPRRARLITALLSTLTLTGAIGLSAGAPARAVPPASPDTFVSDTGALLRPSGAAPTGLALSGSRGNPEAVGGESILQEDTRTPVTDTSVFPARAIGLITRDGGAWCTGWLISRDTVATAGHCVHPGGNGTAGFYRGLRFWPGRDGDDPRWGSCPPRSGGLFAPSGWTANGDEEYDLATIKLNCTVGDSTGWFGLWAQDSGYTGYAMRVEGYPGDKPRTQWLSTGVVKATTDRQVFYTNDTIGGMSGSPVFRTGEYPGCGRTACAAAIHTEGVHGSGNHAAFNHGTRITTTRASQLRSIATAP
jgi:glutamyl endopeptidase